MEAHQQQATISVLVRELDSVRLIAIEAATQVNVLQARIAELEKASGKEESSNGDPAGS